jgi:hypothetical protein
MKRTPTEVIHDHLAKRLANDVEGDITENFDKNILILSSFGVFKGHDGVRASAKLLDEKVGKAVFHYNRTLVDRDYGFLEWSADSDSVKVWDGADSFVVREGKIVLQTIHYTAQHT